MARKTNQKEKVVQPEVIEGNEQATVTADSPVDHFTNVVLEGKAKKLSPKTQNHVFYELSVHDDLNALFLRLSGNEGGGLHSKEWVAFEDIVAVLNEQDEKPFKSTVFKSVFKGGSANNAGFMAAALRGLLLILPSEKSVFLHVLAPDYEQRRDELMSLVDGETEAK
ncbi:TPA: hypothetical protein JG855_003446 [Vibrio parahaemolyticus]|uniref:hypothetical protein n=1 Tax=Vibrio parahaemolyticus TaxID=670 RepID=UPI000A3BA54A|nr:hypothetical protein [Vibrio parahaemolyticus]MBY7719201.1 hypothetical protein [Vibrio parahaemolyticus]MCZ6375642.1 hypothetical protein [Vibrio parahaemolyticus]MDF4661369.1 hypothetical protein [Vibrio parahaemolyticus]MDG3388745.1 hypothetical protein [Vibrio parahaemolyticus]OUJ24325.1 hypothetical protein BTO19_20355 [Vibrio parahaemolyticus]